MDSRDQKPITIEQLAKINALKKVMRRRTRKMLKPFVIAANFKMPGFLMMTMGQYSPLIVFSTLVGLYTNHQILNNAKAIHLLNRQAIASMNNMARSVCGLCPDLKKSWETLAAIYDYAEANPLTLSSDARQKVSFFRDVLIKIIREAAVTPSAELLHRAGFAPKYSMISAELYGNLENEPFSLLAKKINDLEAVSAVYDIQTDSSLQENANILGIMHAHNTGIYWAPIMGAATTYFIVEPLFQKSYEAAVASVALMKMLMKRDETLALKMQVLKQFFRPKNPLLMNYGEAETLIKKLEASLKPAKNKKQPGAWFYAKTFWDWLPEIVIVATLGWLVYSSLMSSKEASRGEEATGYYMLGVLLEEMIVRLAARHEKNNLSKTLHDKANLLSSFLDCELREHDSLAASYFICRVDGYKTLSRWEVCQALKNILLQQGIQFKPGTYGEFTLIIPGDVKFTKKMIDKINVQKERILERLVEVRSVRHQLAAQLESLAALFSTGGVIDMPLKDQAGLPSRQLKLYVPKEFISMLTLEKMRELLSECEVTDEARFHLLGEAGVEFIIQGFKPVNAKKFERFIKELQQEIQQKHDQKQSETDSKAATASPQTAASSSTSAMMTGLTSGISKVTKRRHQPTVVDAAPLETKTTSATHKLVRWGTVTYDSKQQDSDIVPILSVGKHFLRWCIPEEDFPAHKKFFAKVERAKIAGAEGQEGIRFYDEPHQEYDVNGNPFLAYGDIKVKGEHGDTRCYFDMNPGGADESGASHALYTVRGFRIGTH